MKINVGDLRNSFRKQVAIEKTFDIIPIVDKIIPVIEIVLIKASIKFKLIGILFKIFFYDGKEKKNISYIFFFVIRFLYYSLRRHMNQCQIIWNKKIIMMHS